MEFESEKSRVTRFNSKRKRTYEKDYEVNYNNTTEGEDSSVSLRRRVATRRV
jgi:hypothetical protein